MRRPLPGVNRLLSINPKQTDLMQVVVPSEGNDEDRFVLLYVAGSRQLCVVFRNDNERN